MHPTSRGWIYLLEVLSGLNSAGSVERKADLEQSLQSPVRKPPEQVRGRRSPPPLGNQRFS